MTRTQTLSNYVILEIRDIPTCYQVLELEICHISVTNQAIFLRLS